LFAEQQVRAIRGATTVEKDTKEQVIKRTQELVARILEANDIATDNIISVIFTATDDIKSMFPATAGRAMGLNAVPLLCARELDIQGSLALCIRVLMHVYTTKKPDEIKHVYLEDAVALRGDL
jgi:chorismate mutase